jgi:hypothetical protein
VVQRSLVLLAALILAPLTALAQSDLAVARVTMTVDGVEVASFSEFAGVVAEARALEFFETNTENRGRVTLSRPASSNLDLWAWYESGARKLVRLFFYNQRGDLILRYHLESAWPARLEVAPRAPGGAEVLTETITIVAARITRVRI